MAYKTKKSKRIISAIVAIVVVLGAVAGVVALTGKDTKKISPFAFSVGGVDMDGVYVKNTQAIYTEELIECQGLVIAPDTTSESTYQVFYYDADKNFIESSDVMNAKDGTYSAKDMPLLANYCRIMITPVLEVEDDEDLSKVKIKFWEVRGFAKDFEITVDVDQSGAFKTTDFDADTLLLWHEWQDNGNGYGQITNESGGYSSSYDSFDVKGKSKLYFSYGSKNVKSTEFIFVDKDGVFISNDTVGAEEMLPYGELVYTIVNVPKNAVECLINVENVETGTLEFTVDPVLYVK